MSGTLSLQPWLQVQMTVTRVQKRLLHQLAQKAELNLETLLLDSMPTPERSDSFHPAKKFLDSISVSSMRSLCFTFARMSACSCLTKGWAGLEKGEETSPCDGFGPFHRPTFWLHGKDWRLVSQRSWAGRRVPQPLPQARLKSVWLYRNRETPDCKQVELRLLLPVLSSQLHSDARGMM